MVSGPEPIGNRGREEGKETWSQADRDEGRQESEEAVEQGGDRCRRVNQAQRDR